MDTIEIIEPEIKIEYIDTDAKDPLSIRKNDGIVSTECHSDGSLQSTNKECASWFKCINASGKYCCRFCELSYSTLQTLRTHTKKKHTTEVVVLKTAISNNKRSKKFKCHNCKIKFTSLKDLEVHYNNTHKTVKENYCHICKSVFDNQNKLSDHLLSKHNIALSKMHVCDTCGYVTTKLSHYKQHRNTHYSQKVEKCNFCDYKTSYLPNLNIHLQIHNTDKPYSCDFSGCLYKTKSCASLKSHKLKHNKEINFKYCDKCTFKTEYVQTLRKHLDSHERLIDHDISTRMSLTSSQTGVTTPEVFIECEMSQRTTPKVEMMEELQSRSSPVTSKFIDYEKSLTSSLAEVTSSEAFIDYEMSPWTSVMCSPKVEWMELQSGSSPVSSKSTDRDYNVPQKKRKGLTMVPPISQPAQPLQKWEIADLVNNDYGSEDDDSDNDDGKDGLMFPMSSVLPRTQRAWMNDLLEEELSEAQSSPEIIAQEVSSQQAPSTSQLAFPPEVLAQEALPSSSQLATIPEVEISSSIMRYTYATQNSSQPLSQGITESPISLWEFNWKSFSEHTVPPPHERMEHFDQPTGPVRSFETPLEVFSAIWNSEILQHIVEQTNAYAQLITARQMEEGTLQHLSRICNWKDLTIDELQVYFALLIAMGLVYKSNIREYWASQGDITDTPNFGKYMAVNRFVNITRVLHFNDNCDPQLHTLPKPQAKLFKIQPILSHLNLKFQELYRLSREIALDESLTEWKGWLDINQFMKNKSAKIGVKSYEICDSRTGYLWKFKVHAGREATEERDISPVSGVTSKIVLEMVRDLEHRGHILFMDNYYNSPALTRCLKTKGFDVVGTLRPNRQLVPAEFRIKKTQMAPGEIYGATSGDVDIVVFRDQNKVCMISTYHGVTQSRRDSNQKLSVVHDYNVSMGGVDRKDQMLSMYPLERKRTRIWYKKLFRRLFNVSILNAYIILKHTSDRLRHRQFRRDLIRQLLDVHASTALLPAEIMMSQAPCTFGKPFSG